MSYLPFMAKLAKKAGAIMKKNFTVGMKKEWKKDVTPLTETDTAINSLVLEEIGRAFPVHDVLAEEESRLLRKSEYVWVCDPVEGTIPFSHGIPTSMFALALTKNGLPITGVLYDPFLDRMFLAERGRGTTLNGKRIRVSTKNDLKGAVVGIIAWKDAPYPLFGAIKLLEEQYAITLNLCCINYMDALVACGEFVGTIFPGSAPHDSATAKIVVEEAGGTFTNLSGETERYDRPVKGHIASNGILHPALLDIVRKSLSSDTSPRSSS